MQKFLIERNIPDLGKKSAEEVRAAAAKSNKVLADLGPDVLWQQSFVADNNLFCIYIAKDKNLVRKHAELSGFPADRIVEIRGVIDPATAG